MAPIPSSPNQPILSVQMTDEDIIQRVSRLLHVNYGTVKPRKSHHKTSYCVRLKGYKAYCFMLELKPFMGVRRQQQIDQATSSYDPALWKNNHRKLSREQVLELRTRVSRGESVKVVAKDLKIFWTAAYRIVNKETYKEV